jgi:DnaJ-class molecular chaperone
MKYEDSLVLPTFEKGFIQCEKCEGFGTIYEISLRSFGTYSYVCNVCHGTGKINWIQNVFKDEK